MKLDDFKEEEEGDIDLDGFLNLLESKCTLEKSIGVVSKASIMVMT
ncbi:hypothetical protein I6N90_13275 [Paenibacillus sp. GSMTC-2017]|nr:hypothetical protein [Paenibacillus sp. GSMTC-2017]